MKKLITFCLLFIPSAAFSTELILGLGYIDDPLYPNRTETRVIGRIEINHDFKVKEDTKVSINALHLSNAFRSDINAGINIVGVNVKYNF